MATFYLENCAHAKTRSGNGPAKLISTVRHFDYIMREGKYEHMEGREEDFVFSEGGNYPSWAESPRDYWEKLEERRSPQGRGYREIRIALMEELSLEENKELVRDFLDYFGISRDHAYSYAIHDKTAEYDKGHRNIHVHIMFDERRQDERKDLAPDLCFKKYSENKEGLPMGGWKKDRYYNSVECTREMRNYWEKIVNAKFMEKGMDIAVTAKSNKDMAAELEKKGLLEEKEFYDRKPAPHMGGMGKNPAIRSKIVSFKKEMLRSFGMDTESGNRGEGTEDNKKEAAEEALRMQEEAEKAEKMSEEDRKILLFVTDQIFRETARKIQRERKQKREEERRRRSIVEAAFDVFKKHDDPVIVTAGDVADRLEEEERKILAAAAVEKKNYDALREKYRTPQDMSIMAMDKVFKGETSRLLDEQRKLRKELAVLEEKKKAGSLAEDKNAYIEVLGAWHKKSEDLAIVDKDLRLMFYSIKYRSFFEYKAALRELQETAGNVAAATKESRKKLDAMEKRYDLIHTKRLALGRSLPMDRILYSEELPRSLYPTAKLNGEIPLRHMPGTVYRSKYFCFIDEPANGAAQGSSVTLRAVMIGDDMTLGKVPVYEVHATVDKYMDAKGKVHTEYVTDSVKATGEKAAMYRDRKETLKAVRTRAGKSAVRRGAGAAGGHDKAAMRKGRAAVEKLAAEAVQSPLKKLISQWQEKGDDRERKRPQNELERVDEELENGWVSTMHFGHNM